MKLKKLENRVKIIGIIEECPKCGTQMERRKHEEITQKQLRKSFYFSEWDVCQNKDCRMVKHYEHFKVFNKNVMGTYLKEKADFKRQLSFIRELK